MFAFTQSQEGGMLTLAEATKVLEECRRMVTAQRETFQHHLEEGRKVLGKAMGENRQLNDALSLARDDIAALKEENARLAQQNEFINKQSGNKQNSSLRSLLLRVLGKENEQGLNDDEIEKQLCALFSNFGTSLTNLQAEKEDLLGKLKDTNAQLINSKNEIAKREPILIQSAEVLRNEIAQNKALTKRVKDLETELGQAQNSEDSKKMLTRLQNKNISLFKQVKTLNIENADLRAVIDKLKNEATKADKGGAVDPSREDLERQVAHYTEELEKEKVKHELTRQTLELTTKNVHESTQNILQAAEEEVQRLRNALSEEQEKNKWLGAEVMAPKPDASNKRINMMSKELKDMNARIKSLENTEKQLRKSMTNKNSLINTLKIHNADLQRKVGLPPKENTENPTSSSPAIPHKRPRKH